MNKIYRYISLILCMIFLLSSCDQGDLNPSETVDSETLQTPENQDANGEGGISGTNDKTESVVAEGSISCNGNNNTRMVYDINQDCKIMLHMEEWKEERLVDSVALSSDAEIEAFRRIEKAIAINDEHACLFLRSQGKITVVKLEKGSPNETVTSINVSEDVIGFYGNFISENIGYLFVYKEVSDGHARGGAKLSSLFVTEDGGNTWNLIDVQNVPSISLQEHIIFSKMISEDVGLISGHFFADDYDFCDRTLLTTDGGLNWVNVADLPQVNELPWAIVTDFVRVDNSYVLTIRYPASESTSKYGYAEYKLIDLNTWIRIS